jgi:ribosomal protein S6
MNYYEILYIVNPNFERKKIDDSMKEIEDRLRKTKSKIINHVIWGKKKLAYPIQNHKYGTYIMAHYNGGDKNELDEFNSWLKLSDLVIRHMIVRLDSEPDIIDKADNNLNLEPVKEQSANDVEEKSNDSEEEIAEKKEGVE